MEVQIKLFGSTYTVEIQVGQYASNGRVMLDVYEKDTSDSFGIITVNIPDVELNKDEICVKTWSENEWVTQLLTSLPQHFSDTGKRIESGYAVAHVWKFTK